MKALTPAKVTFLMLFVVGGLVTAYVSKKLFAVDEAKPEVVTRNIPVAVGEVPAGTTVTAAHLGVATIPVSQLEPDMLRNERAIIGRVAKEKLLPLRAIRADDLYPPGEYPPVAVAPGMRAVSVALKDDVPLVDGLVRPGRFVDVLFTPDALPDDKRFGGGLTLRLFQGVRVLVVQRSRNGSGGGNAQTVTFELSPQQANILTLARDKGTITLTYNPEGKGDGGVAVRGDDRATLDEILGLRPETPTRPFVSEIYRQGGRDAIRFQDGRRLDDGGLSAPSTGSDFGRRDPAGPNSDRQTKVAAQPAIDVPIPTRTADRNLDPAATPRPFVPATPFLNGAPLRPGMSTWNPLD